MSLKFLCDAMLGKTARWLRMLGFDTFYSSSSDILDNDLLEIAMKESRVLLTTDKNLSLRAEKKNIPHFFLKEKTVPEEIVVLSQKFGFHPELTPPPRGNSRCPTCNGSLKEVTKNQIRDKVPAKTFTRFKEFWECQTPSCKKIYWKGNHWKNISRELARILLRLKKNT